MDNNGTILVVAIIAAAVVGFLIYSKSDGVSSQKKFNGNDASGQGTTSPVGDKGTAGTPGKNSDYAWDIFGRIVEKAVDKGLDYILSDKDGKTVLQAGDSSQTMIGYA